MVSFFPITVPYINNESHGIFKKISILHPDWNETKLIEGITPNNIVYGYYSDHVQQVTGDVTFSMNSETDNGLTISGETNETFNITYKFHSIKIKITEYLVQRFYLSGYTPNKWDLLGYHNGNWFNLHENEE